MANGLATLFACVAWVGAAFTACRVVYLTGRPRPVLAVVADVDASTVRLVPLQRAATVQFTRPQFNAWGEAA